MKGPALSPATLERLNLLFAPQDRAEASRLLTEECGNNLPFLEKLDAVGLERYRFAALKLSEGTLDGMRYAVKLAQEDWRDLLVAAGFGDDANAYKSWSA